MRSNPQGGMRKDKAVLLQFIGRLTKRERDIQLAMILMAQKNPSSTHPPP